MGNYDILITPAISTQPYPKGKLYPDIVEGKEMETYISWVAISYGVSLLGHPAVILPCGRDEKGLPFGIQLVGRYGRDHELLATAAALEGALAKIDDCMRPLPDLRNLGAMKS